MQSILLILLCQFSLDPSVSWDLPAFEKGGDTASTSSVATSVAATSGETAGEGFQRRYLAMFTATYCGPCQEWKATVLKQLQAQGYHVELIEMTNKANAEKYGDVIKAYPSFVVCDWTTGKWLTDVEVGKIDFPTAKNMLATVPGKSLVNVTRTANATSPGLSDTPAGPLVSRPARTMHTSAGDSSTVRMSWNFEGDWSPTTAEMVSHLSEHGVDATGMTRQEMADVHDQIHNGGRVPLRQPVTSQAACPTCPQPQLQRRGGRFFGLFR